MLPQARASSAVCGQGGEQVPGAELGGDEFVPALKVIGEFPDGVEGEFIGGYAGPFTLLVIADLLGVPEQDRQEFADHLQARPGSGHTIGGAGQAMTHNPLEFLYVKFATYIEDRRREPRDDVLTGLAAATFPDLDHTAPHHQGGRTCECNLAPLYRHHHRCKQAEGWWLEQPQPGVLVWRTPAGRTYTTTPTQYAL